MHILIVDDDPGIRGSLDRALRGAEHRTELAASGERGIELAAKSAYDAIVLDLGLPGIDGLEVCRRLRAAGNPVPILMLTARAAVAERVAGLDAGADDYLVKPFALDELLARLRVFERRAPLAPPGGALRYEDLVLDLDSMECRRGDRVITLTRTEFQLLQLFLMNPERALPRDVIFERVWNYDFGPDSNSLDVYVGYLRRKLEAVGGPRLIHTIRGTGYVLKGA